MSDPKRPFEAAVRAACNADDGLQECDYPHCLKAEYPCNLIPPTIKAAFAAALPPDPAPETIEAMDAAYHTYGVGSSTRSDKIEYWIVRLIPATFEIMERFDSRAERDGKLAQMNMIEVARALRASLLPGGEPK